MQVMKQPVTKEKDVSRWTILRRHIRFDDLKRRRSNRITGRKSTAEMYDSKKTELESRREYILNIMEDPEVLRRLSLQEDSRTQLAVKEFMNDMMETFSEINNLNRTESMKKFKGIIKKNVNSDGKPSKPRNNVHFSDENIYIEIPRKRKEKFDVVTEKCNYYCCFGFLFPV